MARKKPLNERIAIQLNELIKLYKYVPLSAKFTALQLLQEIAELENDGLE